MKLLYAAALFFCSCASVTNADVEYQEEKNKYNLGDHNYVGDSGDGVEVYADANGAITISVLGGSWIAGDTCQFSIGDRWSQVKKTMLAPMDHVCMAKFTEQEVKTFCHNDHYPFAKIGKTIVQLELLCEEINR